MRVPASVLALALSTFAIGTTEFVVVGLVPDISSELHVTVATAGLLVSVYALTVTIATPFVTAFLSHLPRRPLLIVLMAVFIATNIMAAVAPTFSILMIARIVMAISHGVFFAVATTVAASAVAPERASAAISIVLTGVTVAMIVGIPVGSLIGNALNWRVPFLIVAALGALSLIGLIVLTPRERSGPRVGLLTHASVLKRPRLLAIYGVAIFGIGGTFVVFTYLSPLLTDVTGLSAGAVSIALVLFGVGTFIGTVVAGRLSDRVGTKATYAIMMAGLLLIMLAMCATVHSIPLMLATVLVWGFFAFSLPTIVSSGAVTFASKVAPDAAGTASGFAISAINLGISGGSFVGSLVLGTGGLLATPWVGAVLVVVGLLIAVVFVAEKDAAIPGAKAPVVPGEPTPTN